MPKTTQKPEFCTRGHSQDPKFGPYTTGVDDEGNPMKIRTVISAPREDRPGRCHTCGAPIMPPRQEA